MTKKKAVLDFRHWNQAQAYCIDCNNKEFELWKNERTSKCYIYCSKCNRVKGEVK